MPSERRKAHPQAYAHPSEKSSLLCLDGSVRYGVHCACGMDAILRMKDMLVDFSIRCGQPSTMDDLAYFLSKPGAFPRVPHLYLIANRQNLNLDQITADNLIGALLLYEYRMLGRGVHAYATNDRSGRGTILALPNERLKVVSCISRALLDRGAHMIMLSFRTGNGDSDREKASLFTLPSSPHAPARWACRERATPAFLALADSFDETLAHVGKRTRRNFRHYRRLAEADLGCTFVPQVEIAWQDFIAFNRVSMYRPRTSVASWRFEMQKHLTDPVMMGLKDRDGRWLAILGGRRIGDRMEILWQMNREDLPSYSLSTVLRSFCIEHEIVRGTKRLYAEGGTPHSLHHSFTQEQLVDLVVVRRSLRGWAMEKLAKRWVYEDNELAVMLKNDDLVWSSC